MLERPFGPSGRPVAVVGQGTWAMEADAEASITALRRGIELGMTHIDTAEMYGHGLVEEIVGRAIAGRRDEVFLVSKVLPSNASRRGTIEACERSLRRLGTDRLDLYLLHWPSRHPVEETVAAFDQLQASGRILAWGVSNFDVAELEAAAAAGSGHVACNQVLYHLEERSVEHAVMPACAQIGAAFVGYSPFGQGRFRSGDATLRAIAADRRVSTYTVSLAFLLREPGTFVIPKSSTDAHVEANAAAGDLVLRPDEIAAIDRAFPLGPPRRGVPTL